MSSRSSPTLPPQPDADPAALAVQLLMECRSGGGGMPTVPNLTEAAAYLVQAVVAARLGAAVGGWKLAIVGGSPVAAPLLQPDIKPSGDTRVLVAGVKIETELGFTLRHDLPAGRAYSRADILAAINSVHAVFELVRPRVGEPPLVPFPMFLADSLGNLGAIVGAGQAMRSLPAEATLLAGGDVAAQGQHPHDDPLAGLLAYANHQGDALGGLRGGQLIITGSFTGALSVTAPGSFEGRFDGLTPVRVNFTRGEKL